MNKKCSDLMQSPNSAHKGEFKDKVMFPSPQNSDYLSMYFSILNSTMYKSWVSTPPEQEFPHDNK